MVNTSASGPMPTSRYWLHQPRSSSRALSAEASSDPGRERIERTPDGLEDLGTDDGRGVLVAASPLLDHPLDHRHRERDPGRLHHVQVDRARAATAASRRGSRAGCSPRGRRAFRSRFRMPPPVPQPGRPARSVRASWRTTPTRRRRRRRGSPPPRGRSGRRAPRRRGARPGPRGCRRSRRRAAARPHPLAMSWSCCSSRSGSVVRGRQGDVAVAGCQRRWKMAGRFSAKAARPSAASAVAKVMVCRSRS